MFIEYAYYFSLRKLIQKIHSHLVVVASFGRYAGTLESPWLSIIAQPTTRI